MSGIKYHTRKGKRHSFSKEEIQFLKDNFENKTHRQLANEMNRKVSSIQAKCLELGLRNYSMEPLDIVGKTFGRLYVDSRFNPKEYTKRVMFKCICSCGNIKIVRKESLKKGTTTSCGCYQAEMSCYKNRLSFDEMALRNLERHYSGGAKKRDIQYFLSTDFFRQIIKLDCHYCGAPPRLIEWDRIVKRVGYERHDRHDIFANGIDRKDNTKGYTEENVVPSCPDCNYAKRTLTYEYFISYINRIASFISKGTDKK